MPLVDPRRPEHRHRRPVDALELLEAAAELARDLLDRVLGIRLGRIEQTPVVHGLQAVLRQVRLVRADREQERRRRVERRPR